MIDWTDKAAFTFFFVALALPFEQIVFVPLGVFAASAFEFVYLVVGALLCFKILIQAKINHPFFSLITVSSFITYILFPLALGEAAFSDSVMQMRTDYFPFLLAILWLMAGTQATVRGFFRNLLVAAACGAGSALAIQHLFPSYVQRLAAGDAGSIGNLFHIAVAGRLWWPNEFTITLFVLLYFTVRDRHSRVGWPLALTALALTLAAAFNTLSRTLLLGIFFILVGSLFTGRGWRELRRRVFQLALASGLLGTFIAILLAYDEKVRNLVDARFFGRGAGIAAIYAIDLQLGRFSLYKQYWEDIQKSFPIGMGFGVPFDIIYAGAPIIHFVTDVSILAFLLPMGIAGVVILFCFLRKIWRLTGKTTLPVKYRRDMRLLILVSLLISLNNELFCRSNFVVALTMLALTFGNSGEPHRRQAGEAHA